MYVAVASKVHRSFAALRMTMKRGCADLLLLLLLLLLFLLLS